MLLDDWQLYWNSQSQQRKEIKQYLTAAINQAINIVVFIFKIEEIPSKLWLQFGDKKKRSILTSIIGA